MFRKTTIRTTILVNILFVVLVVSGVLLFLQFHFGHDLALKATRKNFLEISENIVYDIKERDRAAKERLKLLSLSLDEKDITIQNIDKWFEKTSKTFMAGHRDTYALYLTLGKDDFAELIDARMLDKSKNIYSAPKGTRWIVIKIDIAHKKKQNRVFVFYDKSFREIGTRKDSSNYYPSHRPWFRQAIRSSGKVTRSDPYKFSFLKKTGITYSMKADGSKIVLGADFTIESLNALLERLKSIPQSVLFLFDEKGNIIASSRNYNIPKSVMNKLLSSRETKKIKAISMDGQKYFAMLGKLSTEIGDTTWIGFSVNSDVILKPYQEKVTYGILSALAAIVLLIPLVLWTTGRLTKPIYRLMKENEKIRDRKFSEVKLIESNIVELDRLSRSLLDMSKSIQAYQNAQKKLLYSFIKLIAGAIDKKSPYTGNHCKRVPVIASMLASEVEKSDREIFKEFKLESEEKKEEFELAAWLHDCGKITTPEYVVDKSCKLETIYNRIHEIRTRFEVLWRDVEIGYLKRLLDGESDIESLDNWKSTEHKNLKEDFAFIARCNIGSESMSESDVARIKQIAKRKWVRHFDNTIGLSAFESDRLASIVSDNPSLVEENLLQDRPDHLIPRNDFDREIYEQHNFNMPVPEYLHNRGEIYNLCITHGTLNKEERFLINEHVVATITMLETLPFPQEMSHIPEYAGSHHEKLNGRGYPRGLTKKDLPLAARIMTIADIFEALTAADRPYKKAKKLSATIEIMASMAKNEEIDPDLFDLFLRKKVYLRYALEHIDEQQIDEIDIDKYLK